MKKLFLIKIFICIFICGKSQNLLPNYSFEVQDTCPYGLGQLRLAIPWFQPNIAMGGASGGSTDYFNECYSDTLVYAADVPKNFTGYQSANRGTAYAGFNGYSPTPPDNKNREYLEVQLIGPLKSNKKYCAQFYVSLAERSYFAIDAIGMYFSTDSILYNSPDFLNLPSQPQIENPKGSIIKDSINWVSVSGEFIANGGEWFITIGNFRINDSTVIDTVGNSQDLVASYYYIDDVWVYLCDCDTSPPIASFSYTGDTLTATFNNLSSSFSNYWFWDFGDGNTDTTQNPVHTYDSAGVYTVTLVAWFNGCIDTMVAQVTVNDVGIKETISNAIVSKIYPNPNDGTMKLDYLLKEGQTGTLSFYDALGRRIIAYKLKPTQRILFLNEKWLENGVYSYQITINNEVIVKEKIVVIK